MNRRRLLGAVGGFAGGLSGCLGVEKLLPAAEGERGSPTASPPVEARVEVPPCPERPDTSTRDTVLSFAIRFEKAFVTRRVLAENERVTGVQFESVAGIDDEAADVTATEEGYVVRFPVTLAYGYRPDSGTPSTAVADLPGYTVHYLVTEASVRRVESDGAETPDPRTEGTQVRCPPG